MKKSELLANMLRQVLPSGDFSEITDRQESLAESIEATGSGTVDQHMTSILEGVQALENDEPLDTDQQYVLEAIVLPKLRPVVDVIKDSFSKPEDPWGHYATGKIKQNIDACMRSIGRIELPNHPSLPYGGTGFVVGENLIMTNRHVAEIFATGLGRSGLSIKPGLGSAIDFVQEIKPRKSIPLNVKKVLMIHPYWDMAILQVDGLNPDHPKLRLSVVIPEDLKELEIAVVGYPAQDARNDFALQMQIFRGQFNVKRMQPGKLKGRVQITDGFKNLVKPLIHDASTLGGNSGSAVIDARTGDVVGLHFSGQYLKANYCVPTYELARDSRVVALGVNFTESIKSTKDWEDKWRALEGSEAPENSSVTKMASDSAPATVNSTTFTIPLRVTVSLGGDATTVSSDLATGSSITLASQEGLKEPVIYPRLSGRKGYDPGYLDLDDELEIPLPKLTIAGKKAAAKTIDDDFELKYHHFSIVMHKLRRLAIFTASNVDWRPEKRLVDGRKPTRKELTGLGDNDQEQWVTDPRLAEEHQLPDLFYTKDRQAFDKGHLVRRDDVCWGKSFIDMQKANGDSYHTTNCSPQVAGFNQSARGKDNWGDLETLVQNQTKAEKASVFAGPVFSDDDPVFKGISKHGKVEIPIPQQYWKIVVTKGEDGPQAFGFVLKQDLSGVAFEMAVPQEWKRFTKKITDIESLTGGLVRFGDLAEYDQK